MIQSIDEQEHVKGPPWTWKVASVHRYSGPADEWWERQATARVWGVDKKKVWIRNAK